MALIVFLNALIMSGVWWLANVVKNKFQEITGYFSLIVFWLAFEFFQHHSAIPWPWLTLGNGFANAVKFIQWYEYTGVLGGSLWVLITNILIFKALKSFREKVFLTSIKWISFVLIVIALPVWWSIHLFSGYNVNREKIDVLILQPNIDPYSEKFSGMSHEQQVDRIISLAELNVTDSTELIVAPETALPMLWEDSILQNDSSIKKISRFIQKFPGSGFITGALTQRKISDGEVVLATARLSDDGTFSYDIYNSALFFGQSNDIQVSHKNILVNGVERMPFQKYFSFLGKYVLNLGGTSGSLAAGKEPVILSGEKDLKIGPDICFESAFGEFTGSLVNKGANVLVVLTNDGWWKDSPGTWQHFGYSRIRAIETRRCVVRSANTGISGIINERGEVIKKSEVNSMEAISGKVQLNNNQITFYTSYGDYIGRICTLLSAFILIYLVANRWIAKS
jgi:apolipoprotein N-acyltransferase